MEDKMEDEKNCHNGKLIDKMKEAERLQDDPLYSHEDYKLQLPLDEKHGNQEAQGGFDEALEHAGSWDRYQKWVFFIAYASQIFCGMHAVSAAFLGATPDHWCQVPGLPEETDEDPSLLRNFTIPWSPDDGYSRCEYYDIKDYNRTLAEFKQNKLEVRPQDTRRCSSWVFDDSEFPSTLVSDFSLVCGRLWLKAAVQASYMSGLLIGSLTMGQLSDRYGRRTMTMISTSLAIIVGTLASFANSFPFFLLLRFFLAFLNAGPMVICFVLVMELVKPGVRTFTGMMYAFFFGSGITILPGIAYFIRDWRHLQLAISLLNGILFSYYWLLPESPRWLASQGRTEEALTIMKKIAKTNKRNLPPDSHMVKLMTTINIKLKVGDDDNERPRGCCSGVIKMFSRQIDLIRTPVMRRRCVIGFYVWFVSASAYYGLIFSGGNIRANLFLMIFVSGIVEIPSVFVSIFIMNRIGRRLTMIGLFIATATCCLLILAVPKELVYVNFCLVNLGKFFTTAVFALCFLYTSELVPTVVRNIAVGTSSMFARVGCIITPFVVELLGEIHYALPSTLFGILSIIAASFTLLLPETSNKKLTETVEEVEEMGK
ncbi:organic cation transporter protein-like [Macrobrachium nipponense]|uniref:organic cation transporter protein-like n=1 Tax=Macrobrachium nipponense TaxID=159736 RepID=UPI0030C81D3F